MKQLTLFSLSLTDQVWSFLKGLNFATKSDISRLEARMNAQQQEIDDLTSKVKTQTQTLQDISGEVDTFNGAVTTLETNYTKLVDEIKLLQQNQQTGDPLDLTALETAVTDGQTALGALTDSASRLAANLASTPQGGQDTGQGDGA